MNDVSIVITRVQDVLTWVYKYFSLATDHDFQGNQEYVGLLVEDHGDILISKAFKLLLLQNDSIHLIFRPRFVVIFPNASSLKYISIEKVKVFVHLLLIDNCIGKDVLRLSNISLLT
jgi:hypothetical protein